MPRLAGAARHARHPRRARARSARAESALRRLGFSQLRVRHYGECARIELGLDELEQAIGAREAIVAALHGAGYRYVTLDFEGLRSGNLARSALDHAGLAPPGGVAPAGTEQR